MRILILGILFICFFNSVVLSQSEQKSTLTYALGMTRMDFFSGFEYGKQIYNWKPFASMEIGVNRTFFQKRFFPRLSVGSAYFFLNKEKLHLGPQLSYSFSILNVNKNTNHFHQWNEIYFGSRLEVGSKFRFTNVISGGWMNERFYNQLNNERDGVNSLGFYINFGISYAW
jgi:hypothetical protein